MNSTDFLILLALSATLIIASWVTGKFSGAVHSTLCASGGRIDITASGPITRSKIPNISVHDIQKIETIQGINPITALSLAFSAVGYFAALGGTVVKVSFKSEHSTGFFVVTEIDPEVTRMLSNPSLGST